jgi:hypothetical protein
MQRKLQIGDRVFLGKSIKDPLRIEATVVSIDHDKATLQCIIVGKKTKNKFEAWCSRNIESSIYNKKVSVVKDIAKPSQRRHLYDIYWQVIEKKEMK